MSKKIDLRTLLYIMVVFVLKVMSHCFDVAGPCYGQLKAGASVTLDDGTIIYPNDVLGPPIKGRVVVVCGDTSDASPLLPLVQYGYAIRLN